MKGEVIAFYSEIAETILPHLREWPLTLKRYPDDIAGNISMRRMLQHIPRHGVERFAVARSEGGSDIHYVLCNG